MNKVFTVSTVVLRSVVPKLSTNKVTLLIDGVSNFKLVNKEYFLLVSVGLLLGLEIFPYLLTPSSFGSIDNPAAFNTMFSFVLIGLICSHVSEIINTFLLVLNSLIQEFVHKLWMIEEVAFALPSNEDDAFVESYFQATHYQTASPSYMVPFLIKSWIS